MQTRSKVKKRETVADDTSGMLRRFELVQKGSFEPLADIPPPKKINRQADGDAIAPCQIDTPTLLQIQTLGRLEPKHRTPHLVEQLQSHLKNLEYFHNLSISGDKSKGTSPQS
jgi:hypothetical protein